MPLPGTLWPDWNGEETGPVTSFRSMILPLPEIRMLDARLQHLEGQAHMDDGAGVAYHEGGTVRARIHKKLHLRPRDADPPEGIRIESIRQRLDADRVRLPEGRVFLLSSSMIHPRINYYRYRIFLLMSIY